jgi:hypothetical protein
MSEHRPERGDQVEAYIKRWRDRFEGDASSYALAGRGVLDDLLDDYRLHADTGTPLAVDVPSSRDEIEYTAADRSYDQWAFAQDYGS